MFLWNGKQNHTKPECASFNPMKLPLDMPPHAIFHNKIHEHLLKKVTSMKSTSIKYTVLVIASVLLVAKGYADSPPSNTIPIIADRPNVSEVDIDTFLMLSWNFFDAIQTGDMPAEQAYNTFVPPANETGFFVCLNPVPTARWGHWPSTWVARMSEHAFPVTLLTPARMERHIYHRRAVYDNFRERYTDRDLQRTGNPGFT